MNITEEDDEDYSDFTDQLADACVMIQNMVSINIALMMKELEKAQNILSRRY